LTKDGEAVVDGNFKIMIFIDILLCYVKNEEKKGHEIQRVFGPEY